MLMPRKVAHRKHHRGRTSGMTKGGASLAFGEYGIQALEPGWLSARQIEAARIAMTRAIKRGGKVWINIFPDKPVTKKPAETRMGSGKGNPELWVAVVKPGRVLFELSFPNEEQAKAALNKAVQKLPIKARVITREAAMAVGDPSGAGAPRRVVSSAGRRPAEGDVEATPLIKEADPELEKLLDEEEEIARRTHAGSEAPHFRGED